MRACIVQGSQQIWVAALWYWGYTLNGAPVDYLPPWYIVLVLWPLALMSFVFTYLMLYGLPGLSPFPLLLHSDSERSRILPADTA
jgi:alpha-1,3-glucan synthase